MQQIKLGTQGLVVSVMGLGCMGMSEFYKGGTEKESIETIHRAIEKGVNFFDTADIYGPFDNEVLLGSAIKEHRNNIMIATKFGYERSSTGELLGINGRPDYVEKCCNASLKRLGVSVIDLYYQHRVDPRVPIEETLGAMADLVKDGKVRFLGLSEAKPDTIRRAHKIYPLSALQTEYSIWSREPEKEILATVRELGIGFVAYSPLSRGFLTARFQQPEDFALDDYRTYSPRFQGDNFYKNLNIIDELKHLANAKKITTSQLALAWLKAQGEDICILFGTKQKSHLEENLRSIDIKLTPEDLSAINHIAPPGAAFGARYLDMRDIDYN